MRRRLAGAAAVVCAVVAMAWTAGAVPLIQVGNGPQQPDGSYVNATNLGQNLFFIEVALTAENEVRYAETVNIGTSTFGPNNHDITHAAPLVAILGDVTIGNAGFIVVAADVNLAGGIRLVGGALAPAARFDGSTATSVEVQSNAASLQQAIWLTQDSAGVSTVTAPSGSAASLAFDYDTEMVLSGGQLSGAIAMSHAASRLEIHGRSFRLDDEPVGSGPLSPLSGQLEGVLDSGDAFLVSFTQGTPGQIELVSSTAVPTPRSAALVVAATLAVIGICLLRRPSGRR